MSDIDTIQRLAAELASARQTITHQHEHVADLERALDRIGEREERLTADLAAAKFSEREWRDKAQDKIAEVERFRKALEAIAIYDTAKLGVSRKERKVGALLGGIAHAALSDEDNPPCIKPGHLFLGTQADNNRDKEDKGRAVVLRGAATGNAKLTEADVRQIRERYGRGEDVPHLSEAFGVSRSSVRFIVKRQSWRHVV